MRIFQYWGKTPIHIFKNLNEFQSRKSIYLETSQWNEENQRQREKSYIALGPRQKIFFPPPKNSGYAGSWLLYNNGGTEDNGIRYFCLEENSL